MRKYLPAVILLITSTSCFAQLELGLGYNIAIPVRDMGKHIQPAHQVSFSGNMRLPIKAHPYFWLGVETNVGSYAHKTIEQTFTFTDGSTTKTDVRYNSNLLFTNAVLKYEVPFKGKVVPYVKLAGGFAGFYTNVYIEDPNDPAGCKALDKDLPMKDFAMTYSYGGGIKINLNRNKKENNDYYLNLEIMNTRGGSVDYLNVKHLGEEHQHQDNTGSANGTKPYTAKFINVNTQAIHEHQLAQVYNSPINMLQTRVSFILQFGKSKCNTSKKCNR